MYDHYMLGNMISLSSATIASIRPGVSDNFTQYDVTSASEQERMQCKASRILHVAINITECYDRGFWIVTMIGDG